MSTPREEPPKVERSDRRRQRRAVSMRGYIIRQGGLSEVIELVDLNYGGCGIKTTAALRPGELVKLSLLGRGAIPAVVRWVNNDCAGLDFTPSIPITRTQVARRAERLQVMAEVNLRVRGRNSYRTRVFDL